MTAELVTSLEQLNAIGQTVADQSDLTALQVPPEKLISKLSFTHLMQLLTIADPLQRTFYELEAIKGNWSVRELKRQINSLYFERMGLSRQPEKLAQLVHETDNTPAQPADFIKNTYAFEFLGLPQKALVTENDLVRNLYLILARQFTLG